jgi:hypothetical protein
MIYIKMPCLSKSSSECCLTLATYKAIDGSPLHMTGLAGRFPDFLLLLSLVLRTIEMIHEKTIIIKETYLSSKGPKRP